MACRRTLEMVQRKSEDGWGARWWLEKETEQALTTRFQLHVTVASPRALNSSVGVDRHCSKLLLLPLCTRHE